MYPQPPFNPEELNLLYRAYAAALRDIEFSEAGKNDDPPANETCLVVALRIVAAAANVLPIYGTKATIIIAPFSQYDQEIE